MHWLSIFALIALFIGLVGGLDRMKAMRSAEHPQAEISWRQRSLSFWRYETLNMVAISIHALGLVALAVIILIYLIPSEVIRLFPPGATPREFFILALVAVFYTAYKSGISLAYFLGQSLIRSASYGMSNEGVWYGGVLIRWSAFHHYEIGPDDGQISLYSSYSPALRTWVLQPAPQVLVEVVELIQKHLPRPSAVDEPAAWQRSPLMLILEILGLVLAGLLPALWGLLQNRSWVWIYALVAFILVGMLGNQLMVLFDGRSNVSEPKAETT